METILIISHEVKDLQVWKQGFDAGKDVREKAGVNVLNIYQAVDNPNMVTVISSVSSVEAARALTDNPDLKASMEKAGVISRPEVKILSKF